MKVATEDIETIINVLSSKLPKIKAGNDPHTYMAGRDTGERSAYSDAIRLLRMLIKQHKNKL